MAIALVGEVRALDTAPGTPAASLPLLHELDVERSLLDVRCSLFDVRCWMLDVGCSMLDVRCWMLDVRCWMLDVGCSMLDVGCSMLDVGCWMLDVGYSMFDVRCSQASWGKEARLSRSQRQIPPHQTPLGGSARLRPPENISQEKAWQPGSPGVKITSVTEGELYEEMAVSVGHRGSHSAGGMP
jgi:hypothetical protein